MNKTAGLSATLALVASVGTAQAQENQTQMETYEALGEACQSLIDKVNANNGSAKFGVSDQELDTCTKSFRQSVTFYTNLMVDIGVGMAQGCNEAITTRSDEGQMNSEKANQIAQDGWKCLASYTGSPFTNTVFKNNDIDPNIYEATTVVPYCLAASSGEVAGAAFATEYSGCVNGATRHKMLTPD